MAISSMISFAALTFLLPFLIEGVRGLDLSPELEPRQIFSPTTDPTPLPSQSPILAIDDFLVPLDTCTRQNVTWVYAGPPLPLTLTVTNIGVIQSGPPSSTSFRPTPTFSDVHVRAVPSGASGGAGIRTEIVEDTNPLAPGVLWNVNIPEGWYQIIATIDTTFATVSGRFYVQTGRDTSCLTSIPSSSSSSSPLPSSTPGQTNTPTPTPSSSSPPAQKDSRVGVIVGVVAGVIVFMILVLIAYLCLRRRKNSLDRPLGGHTGGAQLSRGWGGLGSRDSRKNPVTRNAAHRLTSGSIGSPYTAEEQRSNNFSPFEEKYGTSPVPYTQNPFDDAEGGLALATLPSSGDRATSSKTSLHLGQLPPSQQHSSTTLDTAFLHEQGYTQRRSPSIDTSLHSAMQPSQPHLPSHFVAKDMARSSSTGGASSSDAGLQQKKKDNRHSAGTARKTARKPVPAYDPSLPSTISTSVSTATSNSSPSPATPISTSVASSSHGHYAKKSYHTATGAEGTGELLHKSSFGIEGKPVHYLIPDMPPSGGV